MDGALADGNRTTGGLTTILSDGLVDGGLSSCILIDGLVEVLVVGGLNCQLIGGGGGAYAGGAYIVGVGLILRNGRRYATGMPFASQPSQYFHCVPNGGGVPLTLYHGGGVLL